MKLIKISLSFILFCCFVWSVLFFLGPAIIKSVLNYTFNNNVSLHHVEVTPSLNLYASTAEFEIPNEGLSSSFFGTARAVKVDWTILPSGLEIQIEMAEVEVKNFGVFEGLNFIITSKSWWDLREPKMTINVKGSESHPMLNFEKLILLADVSFQNSKASNISIDIFELVLGNLYSSKINRLGIHLDDFEFNKSINKQKNYLTMDLGSFEAEHLLQSDSGSKVTIENADGQILINGQLQGVKIPALDVDVASVTVGSSFSYLSEGLHEVPLKVILSDISSDFYNGFFKVLETNMLFKKEELNLELTGELERFEVKDNQGFLLATLPGSTVIANLYGHIADSKLILDAFGEVVVKSKPELLLSGAGSLALEEVFSIFDCIKAPCNLGKGDFDYRAMIGNETLVGVTNCFDDNCSNLRFYHSLTTSSTENFINGLSLTRMFNPFSLAVIFSEFLKGEAVGRGHRLIIY